MAITKEERQEKARKKRYAAAQRLYNESRKVRGFKRMTISVHDQDQEEVTKIFTRLRKKWAKRDAKDAAQGELHV